jgi:hypothetical protein
MNGDGVPRRKRSKILTQDFRKFQRNKVERIPGVQSPEKVSVVPGPDEPGRVEDERPQQPRDGHEPHGERHQPVSADFSPHAVENKQEDELERLHEMAAAVGTINLGEADVLHREATPRGAVHGAAVVERAAEVVHLGADVEGEVDGGELELELDELDDGLAWRG